MKKTRPTRIGGQAVIEGVMMRGKTSAAVAVRDASGDILIDSEYVPAPEGVMVTLKKLPIVRGVINFVDSMRLGIGTLNKSAEAAEGKTQSRTDGPPSKRSGGVFIWISVVLGLVFAVGLFVVLPQIIMQLFKFTLANAFLDSFVKNLMAGLIRIAVFVAYLLLISRMNDIKRLFKYHGAEHKVINCYEYEKPLTVENVGGMTTKHERCGTTFIFLVMLVGVFFFSFFNFGNDVVLRTLSRILLLPIVAGLSYEILIFSAKRDNIIFRILRAPGMALQRLTTKQPNDSMIEVSLAAFKTVLAMEADGGLPVSSFGKTVYPYGFVRDFAAEQMKDYTPDQAEWILCHVLKIGRASLPLVKSVDISAFREIKRIIEKRKTGMPLQRAIGEAEFYGYKFYVDENVLIPRPETELLTEKVIEYIEKNFGGAKLRVLDLCTGSGAIAVALAKSSGGKAEITASDISSEALKTAGRNAERNAAEITFAQSHLFSAFAEDDRFDIIVCNPPYVKTSEISGLDPEVKDFEPLLALDGGLDGLDFYRRISLEIRNFLKPGGAVFFECGKDQSRGIEALFKDFECAFAEDYIGIERIICLTDWKI